MTGQNLAACLRFLPAASARELAAYRKSFGLWHTPESYFSYLKYSLSTVTVQELQQIYEVEEGLEHRILRSIRKASSYQEYMELLKTKRYTWTRLQRMNTHILTRTKTGYKKLLDDDKVPYIRLLGMTKRTGLFIRKEKDTFCSACQQTVLFLSSSSRSGHKSKQNLQPADRRAAENRV